MRIKDHDLLIPLQLGNSEEAPLFCIPGAGANIAYFRPLAAQLGANTTVYGFQPRGLDGQQMPHRTVEATVDDYLSAFQSSDTGQPLRLIGHSFGGWIAFELAERWHAAGRPVAPLILLDTDVPHHQENPPRDYDRVATFLRLIEILEQACEMPLVITEQELSARADSEQLQLLRERMMARKLISPRTPISAIEDMFKVFATNLNTAYYPSRVYTNPVCLIRAHEKASSPTIDGPAADDAEGWQRYASNVAVKSGPGNHMTMLQDRHAEQLAHIIRQTGFAS